MLTIEQRGAYARLADVLIPPTETMPSATQAGVVDTLIDQVLRYRPDLVDDFAAAVEVCAGREPEAALDELAAGHQRAFAALTLLTAGAYALSPVVHRALNYTPPPRSVVDDLDGYVDLLAAVVERGFHTR
ncbi:hypothetical protein MANY_40000 [Mycolicibacterium anyangense]|uniref:Uncharacterized protein n=2 Tax=Mycolicibacterium anyangense TaxID=1431246 RepID=A0A6N4WE41_9MYCO|nr:hypothetical protein MANY_40000 [Mycolicibacterium anyangense]